MKKYFYNENYFQNINSKEKAYWLGFFYADGYITSQDTFGCGLKQSDKEHLIKFLKEINVNSYEMLKFQEGNNSYRFALCSKIMVEDLKRLGFTTNKSYDNTSIIFDNIPIEYKKYFILGFWDGDGYVSITGEGKNQTGCVSNNEKLLQSIVNFINMNFEKDFCKVIQPDGYFRIRIYTVKAFNFLKWLYSDYDENKVLQRKLLVFKNFKKPYYGQFKYKYLRLLPSKRYFIQSPTINGKKHTIGTFDTIKEAIDAFNIDAKKNGYKTQEYKGEDLYNE